MQCDAVSQSPQHWQQIYSRALWLSQSSVQLQGLVAYLGDTVSSLLPMTSEVVSGSVGIVLSDKRLQGAASQSYVCISNW